MKKRIAAIKMQLMISLFLFLIKNMPVKWIGVGEGIMDFRPFEADKFVDALFDGDK